jgi:hypothetical protein
MSMLTACYDSNGNQISEFSPNNYFPSAVATAKLASLSEQLTALGFAGSAGLNAVAVSGTKNGSNTSFTIVNGSVTTCLLVLNGQLGSVAGGAFTRVGTAITVASNFIPASADDFYALTS